MIGERVVLRFENNSTRESLHQCHMMMLMTLKIMMIMMFMVMLMMPV